MLSIALGATNLTLAIIPKLLLHPSEPSNAAFCIVQASVPIKSGTANLPVGSTLLKLAVVQAALQVGADANAGPPTGSSKAPAITAACPAFCSTV